MEFKNINKVEITQKQLDKINNFFDIDFDNDSTEQMYLIEKLDARTDDTINLFYFDFENNKRITIDLCSGSSNYYENVVLWRKCTYKDKIILYEEDYFDCDYSISQTMEFESDGDLYICEITIKE